MNNEILDFFKDESCYFKKACDVIIGANERIVVKEDMNDLLDYITNLQQENERYKSKIDKAIKDIDKLISGNYVENNTQYMLRQCCSIRLEIIKRDLQGSDKE